MNYAVLSLLSLSVIYPLYYVAVSSFSEPNMAGGSLLFLPKEFTLEGYQRIFSDASIWMGYRNTLLYTVLGTSLNIVLTLTAGYALSRRDMYGKNVFMFLIVFTMFFGGGLIPTYLLVKDLSMVNTIWAMIIPNAASAFNIIITRTFFQTTLPGELLESAQIDGCSDLRFFLRIALPLSLPIVAVVTLFYAVNHWNSYFNALIYLKDYELQPLQIILRNILISNEISEMFVEEVHDLAEQQRVLELMKFGVIVVASLPVLVLYPFLQKYFVKGVMIGSLKE
ncbi:carbohydrate ABC transporter permease [Paenibacillus chungangensis]|uniref:Carbohydrate ABC transporter permease n=1 Tax=Paenibacillus chungangensis TaxID=696535 RepID=A0ABW3HUN3_9BACL